MLDIEAIKDQRNQLAEDYHGYIEDVKTLQQLANESLAEIESLSMIIAFNEPVQNEREGLHDGITH